MLISRILAQFDRLGIIGCVIGQLDGERIVAINDSSTILNHMSYFPEPGSRHQAFTVFTDNKYCHYDLLLTPREENNAAFATIIQRWQCSTVVHIANVILGFYIIHFSYRQRCLTDIAEQWACGVPTGAYSPNEGFQDNVVLL